MHINVMAVALKNGEVICRPELASSAEGLLSLVGVGTDQRDQFVVVWATPSNFRTSFDLSTWKWNLSSNADNPWFNEQRKEAAIAVVREKISSMFLREDREYILGGCWILGGSAEVDYIDNARILFMRDSTQVHSLANSQVGIMGGSSKINLVYSSTSVDIATDKSSIYRLSGKIIYTQGSCSIDRVDENGLVERMMDSSQIKEVTDFGRINKMSDLSHIEVVTDRGVVDSMSDCSQIVKIQDNAVVGEIGDNARVINRAGAAIVLSEQLSSTDVEDAVKRGVLATRRQKGGGPIIKAYRP